MEVKAGLTTEHTEYTESSQVAQEQTEGTERRGGATEPDDADRASIGDDHVTFRYTDSATQQKKVCMLGAAEFLRRYLQHVPPAGQHRVRYFGWLHPSAKARLRRVETLLAKPIIVAAPPPEPVRWHLRCPHCERFSLVRVGSLPRMARAPPRCIR